MPNLERYIHLEKQRAYLLCGLPGSGKTTFAKNYLEVPKLQRFSIDEAMYEKHGIYGVDYPHTIYKELEKVVYEDLDRRLKTALRMGVSVLLDYGFWTRNERDKYKDILSDYSVEDQKLIYFKANRDLLKERLDERNRKIGANALSVDEELFERMHQKFEEPCDEGEIVIDVDKGLDQMPVGITGASVA